jgi:hypothetical protein
MKNVQKRTTDKWKGGCAEQQRKIIKMDVEMPVVQISRLFVSFLADI